MPRSTASRTRCPPTRRCMSWRGCVRGCATSARADVRDPDAVVDAMRAWAPGGGHPPGGPATRAPFVRPSARDVRGQRHGHRQRAGRGARGAEVRAVVVVTSDKCYENRGWEWGYREDEADGRSRPVLELQGSGGARRQRLPTVVLLRPGTASRRLGARRQRDRRRGLGPRAADVGSRTRRAARGDAADPQPDRSAPVAARAQPAERIPGARPGAVGARRRSPAAGTSGPRMGTPSPCRGSWSGCASAGRAGRPGRPTPGRTHTRRHISNSTPPAHACGWAGDRSSRSRPLYTASWTGMRRSPRGPTCDRPRWPSCVRSAARRREGGIAPGRVGRKRTWPRSNSGTVPSTPVSSDRLA